MGLDTSHGCWNGPYSMFMRWRIWVATNLGLPLELMEGFYKWEWGKDDLDFDKHYMPIHGVDDDHDLCHCWWETLSGFSKLGNPISWELMKGNPIAILLSHSDCDGRINWWDAKPIAIELGRLLRRAEDDTSYPVYDVSHPTKAGVLMWTDWRDGRGTYDGNVPATKRFIRGCLNSWKAREHITFR